MKRKSGRIKLLLGIFAFIILPHYMYVNAKPQPPKPRSMQEIKAVLDNTPKIAITEKTKPVNIVLLSDKKDHGPAEHDYPLWQKCWDTLLAGNKGNPDAKAALYFPAYSTKYYKGAENVTVQLAYHWPTDAHFESADCIAAFCYLDWNPKRIEQVKEYLSRGKGLVMIHPASWTKPKPSKEMAELIGIGGFSKYRHGPVDLKINRGSHPILAGFPEKISFYDETYWHTTDEFLSPRINILATCDELADEEARQKKPVPMFWTHDYGKGRIFGCLLGHYNWTFDDPYTRFLLLRGMAWSAGRSPYRLDSIALHQASIDIKITPFKN